MDRETEIIKTIKEMGVFRTPYRRDIVSQIVSKAIKALEEQKTGIIIPDNATNGDMVKTMFPHYDIEVDEHKGYVRIFYSDFYTTYPFEWWNAPYKREEE